MGGLLAREPHHVVVGARCQPWRGDVTFTATPAERFPEVGRFLERKREGRFNSARFVAEQILALAFDPTARPTEVCIRLPAGGEVR